MTYFNLPLTPHQYNEAVKRFESKFGAARPKSGATWVGYLNGARNRYRDNSEAN